MTVPGPNSITPKTAVEADKPITGGPSSTFESYMQKTAGKAGGASTAANVAGSAPAEIAKASIGTQGSAAPTFDSLLLQTRNVQDGLGTVAEQLKFPNLKLKRSQTHLLKNKLQDANEYINAAANKLGAPAVPAQPFDSSSPITRFLGYINHGQEQLASAQQQLIEISKSPGSMNPGAMMLVQIKMNQADQEINFSSILLSKVIDSIKQLLNTQL